jgi:hypothetical protein
LENNLLSLINNHRTVSLNKIKIIMRNTEATTSSGTYHAAARWFPESCPRN